MIEFDYKIGDKTPIVLALGFFDCLHIGHLKLLDKTKKLANKLNAKDCVLTFKNDLISLFKGSKGLICTFDERIDKLEKLQINTVISTTFTKEFSNVLAEDFLKELITNFNVKAVVCGVDYKFGKGGLGNVDTLKKFCLNYKIEVVVVDDVIVDNEKVSTTLIKKLLLDGEIKKANTLLSFQYEISGEVIKDRQVGRKLGFPTANVLISNEKAPLKIGVYKTEVEIDGTIYNCITNYGSRPTYNLDNALTETYIDGYSGDLYGQKITIKFVDYLRDCVKFESENHLISQLKLDLEKIR